LYFYTFFFISINAFVYYKKMVLIVVEREVFGSTNEETNALYFRNAERKKMKFWSEDEKFQMFKKKLD
jgi:hypothetical protein